MQFLSFQVIIKRIKAIRFMLADKTVPKRKKALIIGAIVYLFLPIDIVPPVLFPIGFLDDAVLWLWMLWYLRDELDKYWLGPKNEDLSKKYKGKTIIDDVDFKVDEKETEAEKE